MIATVAVSSPQARVDAVACCIALVLSERSGTAATVVIAGGGPQRPALLASVAAREREASLAAAALPGSSVAARGHLCLASAAADSDDELARLAAIAAGAGPVVASAEPAGLEGWRRELTVIRAELPAGRELLAVLADSLEGPLRVDKQGPGRIGGRRALSGLAPGRAPQARYRWLCRGL